MNDLVVANGQHGVPAVVVTDDQKDLIKRTYAVGATDDELRLYFHDCLRRNVHPMDKLIHFTKRNGKYTPITSIDFMRQRATATEQYAGADEARFKGEPGKPGFECAFTVYRFVQGQRCAWTATARWSEYFPGEQQGFMWKKMPNLMLEKCAEALALRRAFDDVLHGLYIKEEMDQAGTDAKPSSKAPLKERIAAQAKVVVPDAAPVVASVPSDPPVQASVSDTTVTTMNAEQTSITNAQPIAFTLTFGKHNGKAISDPSVDTGYLHWLEGECQKKLMDPKKARYHAETQALLEAIGSERTRREFEEEAVTKPSLLASDEQFNEHLGL